MTMTTLDILELVIGFLWFMAAALWFVAACIRAPALPDLLRRQGRWNRLAALCAGLAAITQAIELILSHATVLIGPL